MLRPLNYSFVTMVGLLGTLLHHLAVLVEPSFEGDEDIHPSVRAGVIGGKRTQIDSGGCDEVISDVRYGRGQLERLSFHVSQMLI